jgi:integrase
VAWVMRRKDVKSGWYVCFRTAEGREVRRAAGKSRRSAERIKAKIETQLREGKFFEREARSTWTLAQLALVYLERMARLRPRSARWRREMFRQVLRALGGDHPIEQITVATLDRYVTRRIGQGKTASTVNREIAVLRHALRQAARWRTETQLSQYRLAEWMPLREAETMRKPVFLTRDEVDRVLRIANLGAQRRGLNGRQGEAVIRLALETGARLGEILALSWGDLDGRGILRIRTEKRGPDRSIDLQESTIRLLEALRESGDSAGPIFHSPRTGTRRWHIRRFWHAVRKGAGIPHVRFHDLRHTAASEMLRRGLLLREVQYVLGHSSPRMTERYAHFARTFKPPKALSWLVQQSVMHESARQAAPTN